MRVIIFFFLMSSLCWSQNLVLNPSFEKYFNCPNTYSCFNNNVLNWSIPTYGSSDYFNTCSKKRSNKNTEGKQNPKIGNGYAGFNLYHGKQASLSPDYREYIQGELLTTLNKNDVYIIKIAISLADKYNIAVNEIELIFTNQKLNFKTTKNIELQKLKKLNIKANHIKFIKPDFLTSKKEWMVLKLEYKAKGFEDFFTIGNFKSDKDTEVLQLTKKTNFNSYYYIDDIEIIEIEKAPNKIDVAIFQPEKTYTFKNVLFDFDKALLFDVSIEKLNKLYKHLETNKHLNIEISGHTDNVGLETRNKELSMLRAKAVSMYLIKKGLNKNRIKWFGFGAEQPVVKNNSEENRAKNRRVDFKLIK